MASRCFAGIVIWQSIITEAALTKRKTQVFDLIQADGYFDETGLTNDQLGKLQWLEKQVHDCREQAVNVVVEVGEYLIEAHKVLANQKNGVFQAWVEHKCNISKSGAYRFMAVARRLSKLPNLGRYSTMALVDLAKDDTPEAAILEAKAIVSKGHTIPHKLAKDLIRKHMQPAPAPSKPDPQFPATDTQPAATETMLAAPVAEPASSAAAGGNASPAAEPPVRTLDAPTAGKEAAGGGDRPDKLKPIKSYIEGIADGLGLTVKCRICDGLGYLPKESTKDGGFPEFWQVMLDSAPKDSRMRKNKPQAEKSYTRAMKKLAATHNDPAGFLRIRFGLYVRSAEGQGEFARQVPTLLNNEFWAEDEDVWNANGKTRAERDQAYDPHHVDEGITEC